jgi:predicted transposase YdaD
VVQEFLDSGRITRIYLDELGEIENLPWGLGLMALTMLSSNEMVEKAREMLQQSETSDKGSAILDLVITAIVYKFSELNRDEVLAMLGLELKEPRAFRETRAEGKAEGKAECKAEVIKEGIEAILLVRFGEIDEDLAAVVPKLMKLDSREYTRLLLNLSRSELLALSLAEQPEE